VRAVLVLALTLGPPRFALPTRDGWFGVDKVKHFVVSAMAQAVTYAGLQYVGARHDVALVGSLATGATVGVARELHGRRTGGIFSVRDLAWDGAGLAAATLFLAHAER
jgi:putative lipoprotein